MPKYFLLHFTNVTELPQQWSNATQLGSRKGSALSPYTRKAYEDYHGIRFTSISMDWSETSGMWRNFMTFFRARCRTSHKERTFQQSVNTSMIGTGRLHKKEFVSQGTKISLTYFYVVPERVTECSLKNKNNLTRNKIDIRFTQQKLKEIITLKSRSSLATSLHQPEH